MGVIVWEGLGRFDRKPIVVIATGGNGDSRSDNTKTGAMVQVWILLQDVHPVTSVQTGEDGAVCGTCPLRGIERDGLQGRDRACYVAVQRGPAGVWKAYRNGSYAKADRQTLDRYLDGRGVRLGSYGDPAAVPVHVLEALTAKASSWTGYTHAWRRAPWLKRFCMASVDTLVDRFWAKAAGWRTFRARLDNEAVQWGEIVCPASDEGGHVVSCLECRLCSGTNRRAKDIVIVAHGMNGDQPFRRLRDRIKARVLALA